MTLDLVIQNALEAVNLPEVQEMIRRLSGHGLAVALPHAHGEDGRFIPLPAAVVAHEAGLKVSFVPRSELNQANMVPVMWRWDGEAGAIALCALCDKYSHRP